MREKSRCGDHSSIAQVVRAPHHKVVGSNPAPGSAWIAQSGRACAFKWEPSVQVWLDDPNWQGGKSRAGRSKWR